MDQVKDPVKNSIEDPAQDLAQDNETTGAFGPLTKSVDIDEALMLIDLSHTIASVAAWREEALFRLPQASRQRRQEIMRSVQRMFLETADDAFVDTPLRSLLAMPGLDERCKRDLLFASYLKATPLVWEAIRQVILPGAIQSAKPQFDDNLTEIPLADLNLFLEQNLRTYTETTLSRTRNHITAHLTKFGILESHPVPGDRIAKRFFARFYEPDPRAFWLSLAQEFAERGTASRPLTYIVEESWTRVAYCTRPAYTRYVLEEAERQALVTTNYFGTEKQITFRGGDPVVGVVEAIRYG